jgi:hypothetical protein
MISIKSDGTDFNSLSGDVFLFEFSGDVTFDESGFANSSISNEYYLEFCDWLDSLHNK